MTKEEIIALKGKVVAVKNRIGTTLLGYIYRIDDDTCYLVDCCSNCFSFYWKQKDDVKAATSDEVMQAYLKDCKSCVEDMNLEDNFND